MKSMHENTSPWDEISKPERDRNVKLVPGVSAVPCYWARDVSGAYLFLIDLTGDFVARMRSSLVAVKGIDLNLLSTVGDRQQLVLALQKQGDRDLFESFCLALVRSLGNATDSDSAFTIAWEHVRRWKAFLGGSIHHLSPEVVRGLFAELHFLQERLEVESAGDVVESWTGPLRSQQDFMYGNTAVEIKSLIGTDRNAVRISSEDQLDSSLEKLFLRVYRLRTESDANKGSSLNQLVENLRERIDDSSALDKFDAKLNELNYQPLPFYDTPYFSVGDVYTYRVEDDFPRLIRSKLSTSLTAVAYDIKLEGIEVFKCSEAELREVD